MIYVGKKMKIYKLSLEKPQSIDQYVQDMQVIQEPKSIQILLPI